VAAGSGRGALQGARLTTPPVSTIVVFDFDHTLIEGDSFWNFLSLIAGWPHTILALIGGVGQLALGRLKSKHDPQFADHRTFLKAHLLERLVTGRKLADLPRAVETLRQRLRWKESVRTSLQEHHAAGHHVVIASGGLDLYLVELLQDVPHHGVICTQIGVADGTITGAMVNGNCVRLRKAELVAEYLQQHGPFAESWGYGNLPHDLPMLELVKHRIVI